MKKSVLLILLIGFTCLVFIACTKVGGTALVDDPTHFDPGDDVFPVIVLNKPSDNQVYANGDSIVVNGYATDNKIVYKGNIKIIDDAIGLAVNEQNFESHIYNRIDFNVAYKADVSKVSTYTIQIEFEDHGLNVTKQELKVKVNP